MVSTFTPNKHLEQPANNDYVDSWDVPVNADWTLIDKALGSSVNINLTGLSGNVFLTLAQYQPLRINLSGSPAGAVAMIVPSGVGGLWVVRNDTTGGFAIGIGSAAGGGATLITANANTLVTCDGTATGMSLAISTTSALVASSIVNTGSTVLGNSADDVLAINGTGVTAPNGLAINTDQLVLNSAGNQVAIAATPEPGMTLTVGGMIRSTSGGYRFPDGSVQTTAMAWRLIGRVTTTANQGLIQFAGIPPDINDLMFTFNVAPVTNNVDFLMQLERDSGVVVNTNVYDTMVIATYHGAPAGSSPFVFSSEITAGGATNCFFFNAPQYSGWRVGSHPAGIRGRGNVTCIRSTSWVGMQAQSHWLNENSQWWMSGSMTGQCGLGVPCTGLRFGWSASNFQAGGQIAVWGSP